jgi:hypothetical protein
MMRRTIAVKTRAVDLRQSLTKNPPQSAENDIRVNDYSPSIERVHTAPGHRALQKER